MGQPVALLVEQRVQGRQGRAVGRFHTTSRRSGECGEEGTQGHQGSGVRRVAECRMLQTRT